MRHLVIASALIICPYLDSCGGSTASNAMFAPNREPRILLAIGMRFVSAPMLSSLLR